MNQWNILIFLLCLCYLLPANAQKLRDKRVAITYTQLPERRLPNDYNTYSVRVYGNAITRAQMNHNQLANKIQMDGFKRLDGFGNNFGHIRVNVYMGSIYAGTPEPKSKTTKSKDKEGNETSKTSYWYETRFRGRGVYTFYDPQGNILIREEVPYNKTSRSSSKSTSTAAYKANRESFARRLKKQNSSAVNDIISDTRRTLTKLYDFNIDKINPEIYFVKKHGTADDFEKYVETTTNNFKSFSDGYMSEQELREKMKSAMGFWQEVSENNQGGKKDQKKLFKAATYNLAVMSFYLNDMERAAKYAQMVIRSEGKDAKSKSLLNRIDRTRELMNLHDIHTLYFLPELRNAQAPSKVRAIEDMKDELKEENNSMRAVAIIDGQKIEGTILQEKEAKDFFFGESGNTKFVVEQNGKLKEYDLTDERVSNFALGDRQFEKIRFSPSAKGKAESAVHIMEHIYASEKINLYKYYPSTGMLSDQKSEFAFQKSGEDVPVSLLDTQFLLWEKGLSKYFADCPDLKEMCGSGGIKMNKDDLVKASRIYAELCE